MAHHRRRHRRHYRDYVSVPGFGDLKALNPFGKHVASTDLFIGAGLGLAVGAAIKLGLNKLNLSLKKPDGTGGLPDAVLSYAGPISTFLAGLGLYVLQRKVLKKSGKLFGANHAEAHLIGATLAAATPIYWTALGKYGPKLKDGTPFFSDYVMTEYGLLTQDASYGLLTQDTAMGSFSGDEDWDPLSAP